MARPWSRALGPYRFWTRPSTSSVSTSFICTNKHGSELEKGEREKLETERKKEAREVGRAGRRRVLFYLFIYEGMGAKDCVKNETSSFTSNYTRDID